MPSLPEKPGTSEPTENRLVTLAKEDLAERLSIDIGQIELVEFEAVVWPDGGLGCPQPGMVYTQVPQDGALIILAVGEKRYEYHSGGARPPFLCEKAAGGTPVEPPPGFGDD